MTTTYTTNTNLRKPAAADRSWDGPLNANADLLDALAPVGGLCVSLKEVPSTSLNVKVAAGSYRHADGSTGSYAGTASQAMTGGATNYLYLTDAGTLTVNTSGYPATVPHVRLATVVAGVSTITSLTDDRVAFTTGRLGGPWRAVATVTTTYTATAADGLIRADATGGAFTVTLPTPAGITGKEFVIKRISASNNVTVATAAGSFDGASTKVLGSQYAVVRVVSNGTTYDIIGTFGTVT